MTIFKKILAVLLLLIGGRSRDGVELGLCDYSGQGRDKYGN